MPQVTSIDVWEWEDGATKYAISTCDVGGEELDHVGGEDDLEEAWCAALDLAAQLGLPTRLQGRAGEILRLAAPPSEPFAVATEARSTALNLPGGFDVLVSVFRPALLPLRGIVTVVPRAQQAGSYEPYGMEPAHWIAASFLSELQSEGLFDDMVDEIACEACAAAAEHRA